MAILRNKEIKVMNESKKNSKLKELKMELIKANVQANRTNAKTKEIKKAIARILTSMKQEKKSNIKITASKKEEVKQK